MEEERILFSACDEKWMDLQNRVITIIGKPIEDVSDEEFFAILSALTNEEASALINYKLRLLSEAHRIKETKFRAPDGRPYVYSFEVTIYDPLAHRFLTIQVDAIDADAAKTIAIYQFHAQFPRVMDPRTAVVRVVGSFNGKPWPDSQE